MSKSSTSTAKDRALGLLAVRWRSRAELKSRLRRAGFESQEIETALEDLEAVGLVDDERFAAELVRDRAGRKLAGPRAIQAALREKGVPAEAAERAMAEIEGDERERALRLAEGRAARLTGLAPEAAYRRLLGLLQRRGYPFGLARWAATEALKERTSGEEWDESGES
jgi:regulatory protein